VSTTALTIVNAVLARMREGAVNSTTFSTDLYAQLILRFVNDTKQEVEDAWDWTVLRQTKSVATVLGTANYIVSGIGQRYRFYDRRKVIWNVTKNTWITPWPQGEFEEAAQIGTTGNQIPSWYRLTGADASGNPTLGLYPTPDGVYSLKLPLVVPDPDLVAHTDTFSLSQLPIELGAWARAISERGEDGGTGTAEQWGMYRACLADYIAMDAGRVEDEVIWEVC
jgi:hypothetical protein